MQDIKILSIKNEKTENIASFSDVFGFFIRIRRLFATLLLLYLFNCEISRTAPRSADVASAAYACKA